LQHEKGKQLAILTPKTALCNRAKKRTHFPAKTKEKWSKRDLNSVNTLSCQHDEWQNHMAEDLSVPSFAINTNMKTISNWRIYKQHIHQSSKF